MPNIDKLTFSSLLPIAILVCVAYVGARQNPSQQPRTQRAKTQSAQALLQDRQIGDQIAQLQKQIQDLQIAIDDLRSKQVLISARAEEANTLATDSRVLQAQDRDSLNSLSMTVGRGEERLDKLGQEVSRMTLDLQRVKTKVGLY